MRIFQVLVLILCFVAALCATEAEIEYMKDIRKLEESASTWTRPTNASSYESHGIGNICTYILPYDFVIIGGGTGGSVVANRLTEISNWKVLLLEAGGEETKITRIPAEMYYLAASDYNWGYKTEPLDYFGGYDQRRAVIRSGRVLGGNSAIDYLLYTRGNAKNFDNWANKTSPDWSYENVLPYFKKSELEGFYGSDIESHGHSGPMHVEHPHYDNDISRAYMQAQMQRGRQFLDYNSQRQCGFATPQVHQVRGVRQSSADAFLTPVQNRLNLKILLNAFVLKININKITKKAESVKFVSNNKCYIVPVVKEVILSAGAIASPKILMLSGVGIKSHLESLNIPVIADLPVGNNLRNFLSVNYPVYSINFTYPQYNLETLVENYLNKKGFLTGPTSMQVMQYVNTENSSDTCVPNIEYTFIAGPGKNDSFEFYKNVFGYTNETYESMVKPIQNLSTYSAYIIDLYPKTQGTIRLKSNVPYDNPKITMPYFEDSDDDVKTLLQGIRDFQDTANTPAMKQYNATMVKLVHPLCQNYTWDSDSFWKCMIMNLAQILHHYTGTCKMGRADDPTAVVGPDLKVFHIDNVRVVDSSVIPESTSGNTRTVMTMVAEKAADKIKEHYGRLSK